MLQHIPDELDLSVRACERERLFEEAAAAAGEGDPPERVESADDELDLVELTGELEAAGDVRDCSLLHVGPRERTARRQRLEQLESLTPGLVRFRRAARAPEDLGKPGERLTLLQPTAAGPPKNACLVDRLDRVVDVVG